MSLKQDFKMAGWAGLAMAVGTGTIMAAASCEPDYTEMRGQAPSSISGKKASTELLDDSTEHALAFILASGVAVGAAAWVIGGRQDKKNQQSRRL